METKTTHTPGPWKHVQSSCFLDQIIGPNDEQIIPGGVEIGTADVKLMAAAPELLAFAKKIIEDLSLELGQTDQATGETYYEEGIYALLKARGE